MSHSILHSSTRALSGISTTRPGAFISKFLLSLLLFFLTTVLSVLHAETVSHTLDNGTTTLADYRKGDENKPAFLLLHGFLQTHNFSTIQSMADELADTGYTVLAPTLSHGVDNRNQSIACDALHTHKFGTLLDLDCSK